MTVTQTSSSTGAGLMEAARVTAPGRVELLSVAKPSPRADQILVRLQGCGVCASNIPPWEGREWFSYPMEPGALGHEGWGLVEELGAEIGGFKVGDRIAFLSNHAYAEYDVCAQGEAVKLPVGLSDGPFPGEPLGCAMNILRRAVVSPGDTVAIVGAGFLGNLLVQLCHARGAKVIAIDRKEGSLKMASAGGADEVLQMDDHWRVIEAVRNLTGGKLCDVVIESTGKQWPLDVAAEITREMGHLVIAGYHQDGLRQVNLQLWNWRGLEVTNAHERDPRIYVRGIEEAVEAVASGTLDANPLYTHSFSLGELNLALEMTRDRSEGFMKALILMEPAS